MRGKILLVGLLILGIAVGGGGAIFLYPSVIGQGSEATATAEPTKQAPGSGPIYQLKERVLNLADRETRRYLKLGLAIEFQTPAEWTGASGEALVEKTNEFKVEMDRRAPLLNDAITSLVTAKTSDELGDLAGKDALKEELRARFSELLEEPAVVEIYFTEFLMQ